MAINLFKKNVAASDPNNLIDTERDNLLKEINYAKGYSKYIEKHGGPDQFLRRTKYKDTGYGESSGAVPNTDGGMFDKQSNVFKRALYGYKNNNTDDYEDPTYLIFEIKILREESSLFNLVEDFMSSYSPHIAEINERVELYDEFLKVLFKIFPSESHDDDSGLKRHYIETVTGMDVFDKKIINYPEDKITFTLSEDITLISHYLAELYNNLVFSYDTQRNLIPENLLRFNLQISMKDIRNMRTPRLLFDSEISETTQDSEIDTMSKIIYTLHDCQFDFFSTKSITDSMTVGGWGSPAINVAAKNSFTINFKSFSKTMAPYLIKDGKIIDFRERDNLETNNFTISEPSLSRRESTSRSSRLTNYVKKNASDASKLLKNESTQVRAAIINKLTEEVSGLLLDTQNALGEQFGLTLTKVNVYYDTIPDKIDSASNFVGDFIDKTLEDFTDKKDEFFTRFDRDKVTKLPGDVGDSMISGYPTDADKTRSRQNNVQISEPLDYSIGHDLDGTKKYNEKYPDDDNIYKEESTSNRNADGSVRENLVGDGTPKRFVYPIGNTYNEKFPEGDLQDDATYHYKEPDGDLQDDATYHYKEPNGDLETDATYNQKFPDGDTQADGIYNQKFPDGDLEADTTYNQKFPDGDLQDDSIYNQKFPEGDVQADSTYNQKLPSGDVQGDATYNQKFPEGDLEADATYNQKFPEGDVEVDGIYNEKLPSGDVQEDGQYNEKNPKGSVQKNPDSIDKKPSGDNIYGINKKDTNNKKPDGDVYNK